MVAISELVTIQMAAISILQFGSDFRLVATSDFQFGSCLSPVQLGSGFVGVTGIQRETNGGNRLQQLNYCSFWPPERAVMTRCSIIIPYALRAVVHERRLVRWWFGSYFIGVVAAAAKHRGSGTAGSDMGALHPSGRVCNAQQVKRSAYCFFPD